MHPELSILKTLVYFDLFDYPLTKKEIKHFSDTKMPDDLLELHLQNLTREQKIWQSGDFYSLQNKPELAGRRRKGNQQAAILLAKAKNISRLLCKFPYVRAIGVSGSVSKNFADENADIDYFVITRANRLWIARTLMHLFKKLPFLEGRKTLYCMNYYVDELNLVIEEKNIYTATELVTLVPMAGNGSFKQLFDSNSWAKQFLPNAEIHLPDLETVNAYPWYKKFIEKLFNNRMGDWLDDYLLNLTTRRWKLKEDQQRLNTKGALMGLKTSKHCSKPNPRFFHDWFIHQYEQKLQSERLKWGL